MPARLRHGRDRGLRVGGVEAVWGLGRDLDRALARSAMPHAGAEAVFGREVQGQGAAGGGHGHRAGTAAAIAPVAEPVARVRMGEVFRLHFRDVDREAMGEFVRRKRPRQRSAPLLAVHPESMSLEIRVDTEEGRCAEVGAYREAGAGIRPESDRSRVRGFTALDAPSSAQGPPRHELAGAVGRGTRRDGDRHPDRMEAVGGWRADLHRAGVRGIGAGQHRTLDDVVGFEPGGGRVGGHRAPPRSLVVPTAEEVARARRGLQPRRFEHVLAGGEPGEAGRRRDALSVDDEFEAGGIGGDGGGCRRLAVEPRHAIDVSWRQFLTSHEHAGRDGFDAAVMHD